MGNNITVMPPPGHVNFDLLNIPDNEPTLIIKPFLFLGGTYAHKNPRVLEYLGITHILNMAAEQHLDTVYLTNCNINVKHIPAEDYESYNIRQHFEEAFQFIEDCLTKNGRILVHCAVGISRSPTIVIAYIMYRYGMSYQNAYQYVQNLRPIVNPNNSFKMQLQEFDYELFNPNGLQHSQTQIKKSQHQQLSTQQQYILNLLALHNYIDNKNKTQANTNNFNMNVLNPVSIKGSKKNYHINSNPDINTGHRNLNYMDQNLLYQNVNNGYYMNPNSTINTAATALQRIKSIRNSGHYSSMNKKIRNNERVKSSHGLFKLTDLNNEFERMYNHSKENINYNYDLKQFMRTKSSVNNRYSYLNKTIDPIYSY